MAKKYKRLRIGKRSITLDFDYDGARCLERLDIDPTPANIKLAGAELSIIRSEIELGTFYYAKHFPHSRRVKKQSKTIKESLWEHFEFWKINEQPKQSTIKEREKEIKRMEANFGHYLLNDLAEHHILSWIKEMEEKEKSGRTINNLLTPLRQTMERAFRRREIDINPFEDIKCRKYKPKEPNPFHITEFVAILPKLKHEQCRNYAQFNFFTGLRPSEMIALQWNHINFVKKKAIIKEAIVRFNRQDTKTCKDRVVNLPQPAIEALEKQKQFTFLYGKEIFQNPLTGKFWASDKAFRELHWKYACKAAGVTYRPPEMLRHSFASLMFEKNKPLGWIANQMGNSVEVVAKNYARWLEHNKIETDDLGDLWNEICRNPVGIDDSSLQLANFNGKLVAGAGFEPATFGL